MCNMHQPQGERFNQWAKFSTSGQAGGRVQASEQNREKILGRQALLHSGAQTGTSNALKMQVYVPYKYKYKLERNTLHCIE